MNKKLPDDQLYNEMFQRNRGIINEDEQQILKGSHIAIAGTGGVGGIYMATLARTGVGHFTISDPDTFDHSNINRQYGATMDTIGQNKAEVMKKHVQTINPNCEISILEDGLTVNNVDEFLSDCDLVLDCLDAYNIVELIKLYDSAQKKGLYVLKSIPFGFGATLLVFSPSGMSFEEYFSIEDPESITIENLLKNPERLRKLYTNWINGYTPSKFFEGYLDKDAYNPFDETGRFTARPLPSFCPAVWMCASLIGIEVTQILLNKRPPIIVPQVLELDLYSRVLNITGPEK